MAWLALIVLLLQMSGGPAVLTSLLAKDDSFAALALKYLCSGTNTAEAASRAANGQPQPVDTSSVGHHHCILCQGGVSPLLPALLGAISIILIVLALPGWRLQAPSTRQVLWLLRHSRAPPLAA